MIFGLTLEVSVSHVLHLGGFVSDLKLSESLKQRLLVDGFVKIKLLLSSRTGINFKCSVKNKHKNSSVFTSICC